MVLMMAMAASLLPRDAAAQLGALVSPGRLSRAHAALEGITNCLQCHTVGQGVAADKCLTCHAPVAARIAQKKGIHRAVTTDCVACHVEHAGADAELRPFDLTRFDHGRDAASPLDGLHAALTTNCEACHTTRSFLSVGTSCASCHTDAHKGALGPSCETCHTTRVGFADTKTGFDHGRTAFPLTGAHGEVVCESCHRDGTYKGIAFASCTSCHTDTHKGEFGAGCVSCHTTASWRTTKVDHGRTAFPLLGLHRTVQCVACHPSAAARVAVKADTCATCHTDPHGGVFKQDCASCHAETGFAKVERSGFDHATTRFPLLDRHAELACGACHTTGVEPPRSRTAAPAAPPGRPTPAAATTFTGLRTDCVACHSDVHRGELGTTCETCHTARTFEVDAFSHARPRPFFDGQHAALTCAQCHTASYPAGAAAPAGRTVAAASAPGAMRTLDTPRTGFTTTSESCVSCHTDVHLGQVDSRCETCHTVETPRFAVARFAHERTAFPLTGKHAPLRCEACHTEATREFPSGHGTALQLTGIGTECASCHQDPHRNELGTDCTTCHTTDTFAVTRYTHRSARALRAFFTGRHQTDCVACHKPGTATTTATLPAAYRIPTTCTSCHTDEHRGALGPRCETCHKP